MPATRCARATASRSTRFPADATVGTGSPRRRAQLLARRPDLSVADIRGNVDTRLGKVGPSTSSGTSEGLDAVILAAAGLARLGRLDAVTEYLGLDGWPTAPGQGALAIEVRAGEEKTVSALDHTPTRTAVEAEREVLALLEAGCAAPVGAHAFIEDGLLFLSARVYSLDGSSRLTSSHALYLSDVDEPGSALAARVARELLDGGAATLAPLGARAMTTGKPLAGWRVLVPRGGKWGDGVAATLRSYGAVPVIAPLINFAASDDEARLAAALRELQNGAFDWIVITSATTVDVLMSQNVHIPQRTRIAAVGETTGAALSLAGYRVDYVPEADNSARGLLKEWPQARIDRPGAGAAIGERRADTCRRSRRARPRRRVRLRLSNRRRSRDATRYERMSPTAASRRSS